WRPLACRPASAVQAGARSEVYHDLPDVFRGDLVPEGRHGGTSATVGDPGHDLLVRVRRAGQVRPDVAPALEAMAGVAPVCQVQTLPLVEHLRLDRALATRGADPHEPAAPTRMMSDIRALRSPPLPGAGGAPPGFGLRGDSFRRPPETVKREPGACRARRGAGASRQHLREPRVTRRSS